jgi:hypothetical protein
VRVTQKIETAGNQSKPGVCRTSSKLALINCAP